MEPPGRLLALAFRFSQLPTVSIGWLSAGVRLTDIGIWGPPPGSLSYLIFRLVLNRSHQFLERNHFNVVVTDEAVNYMPIIRATTATCHLQIARLAPDGSNRDLIRHLAAGTDRTFIVFRGTVYAQQPVVWTILNYLLVEVSSRAWID
jgi:hypothetical protein